MNVKSKTSGTWRIIRQSRETGEILGVVEKKNSITEAGFFLWMDILTGVSTAYFDTNNSRLRLYDDTPDLIKTFVGADANFPRYEADYNEEGRHVVIWQWSDISVDVYEVDSVTFDNSPRDPVVTFSEASPIFDGGNSKPDTENWIYQYILETAIAGGEDYLQLAAMALAALHLGNVTGKGPLWNTTNIKLSVRQGVPEEITTLDCTAILTPTHSPVEGSIGWRFISSYQDGAHHAWNDLAVLIATGNGPLTLWLHTGIDLGTQVEEEMQWTVNFTTFFEFD